MDKGYLAKILDARDALCGYCKSGSCELCDVRSLVKDAFDEFYSMEDINAQEVCNEMAQTGSA